MDVILKILVVLAVVGINAFFVITEFAIVTVRKTRIERLAAEGNILARRVAHALENPAAYIAAAQLGVTMASLALGWIGEPTIASLIESVLQTLAIPFVVPIAHSVAIVVTFLLITGLTIILGELTPKSIALRRPETTALLVITPAWLFMRIFWPFIWLLNAAGDLVLRALRIEPPKGQELVHTVDELKMLVSASRQAGILEEEEEEMVERVFDFGELRAHEVMVPRTEVVAVSVDTQLPELLRVARESHHSRIPVYEGSIDNIVGILHIRDLVRWLAEQPPRQPFDLRRIMRPALMVPETITVTDLLQEMKRAKTHLAVLVDEYGGTAGIVTLEDLLEEIVGNVADEFEPREVPIRRLPDGSAIVDGLLNIEDVNQELGLTIPQEEYDTIGGFVFGQLGRRPEIGDQVVADDAILRVEALDGLRVAAVRIIPLRSPQEMDQSSAS